MKCMTRWILPLLLILGNGTCFAQSTNSGDIRGSVTDSSGALIPSVTVTVLNVDTGVSKDYITNQDGIYDTSSILTGSYKLTFVKSGFEKVLRGPITLDVGVQTLNAALEVGGNTEKIVVTADLELLDKEDGSQTDTLDSQTMAQLPQYGADWENFVNLLPGSSFSYRAGQSTSINGNLPYSSVLSDGATTTLPMSTNSDVTVFFSEVLPALKPGTIWGLHDIFLPWDYPQEWRDRFYNEQYLLLTYLLGGIGDDDVLLPVRWASSQASLHMILQPLWEREELFRNTGTRGGCFWARRRSRSGSRDCEAF